MADVQLPTIVENSGFGGMGGLGVGAGLVGGLILGSMWNGGWGGWGNRGTGQVGADVALANAVQNVGNQVQQGTISQLQSAADTAQSINANTVAGLQQGNAMQQQMCCCCNNLSHEIDATGDGITDALTNSRIQDMQNTQQISNGLANLGQAISYQGYQNQLATKDVLAAMAQQTGELSREIFEQNCQNRELQREIQYQNTRDQLAQCQSEKAALLAQASNQAALNAQTNTIISAIISALKPTTAATAAAA